MKKISILILGAFPLTAFSQTLTSEQAVESALQQHPQVRAAALEVDAKRIAERAARAFENPEINVESPTGEFYAVGVLQAFEFPTVYKNRKKVAQAETQFAVAGQKTTENELRFAVRTLFLETQVATFQLNLQRRRDSIFQTIREAAARQFTAGEIDLLQRTLAENEAGAARQNLLVAQKQADNLREQLQILTGAPTISALESLAPDRSPIPDFSQNPTVLLEKQGAVVAQRQTSLAQSQNMPNFSVGYLNQGLKNTPYDYRFRAAVGVPIWIGQNRATRESAQVAARAAESRTVAAVQNLAVETSGAQNTAANALAQIEYFEREALPRSRSLIETATRLRAAGQIDYPTFLRTLDTAFANENEYLAQIQRLNAAQIRLRFLAGL